MDPVRRHTPSGQAHPQVTEKARWPANVEVAISRNTQLVENVHPQVTCCIVVPSLSVIRSRPAVADLASPARKHCEKLSHLCSEGLGFAIACTVQPPDLPRRAARGEGMQHCEHGCCADSSTQ